MFEIDEPVRRKNFLSKLGGVEQTMTIEFGGEVVTGVPEADVDRTTADGKASSVQFLHFPFTEAQIKAFRKRGHKSLSVLNMKNMRILPSCRKQRAWRSAKISVKDFVFSNAPKAAAPNPAFVTFDLDPTPGGGAFVQMCNHASA